MAGRILKVLDGRNEKPSLAELQEIEGVGPAKASLIAAALEFARRRIRPEGLRTSFPPDVLPLIRHYADRKQEHSLCVSLNGANEVIATRVVSVGLVNKAQVHPHDTIAARCRSHRTEKGDFIGSQGSIISGHKSGHYLKQITGQKP